jgi:hypothetical protein
MDGVDCQFCVLLLWLFQRLRISSLTYSISCLNFRSHCFLYNPCGVPLDELLMHAADVACLDGLDKWHLGREYHQWSVVEGGDLQCCEREKVHSSQRV